MTDGAVVDGKAPHAGVMEFGARPYRAPLRPLVEWVKRKGFADDEKAAYAIALAVQRKIAAVGIEPRHFFQKASDRARPVVEAEIEIAIAELGYGRVRRGRGRSGGGSVGDSGTPQ